MKTSDKIRQAVNLVHVACDTCLKEVPLSEAVVPEANDYFVHFCGLECYEKWKQLGDQHNHQHAHSARRIP